MSHTTPPLGNVFDAFRANAERPRIDQAEVNARQIIALAKRGEYTELREQRTTCPRHKARTIARYFMGKGDAGELRGWVLVPGFKLGWTTIPPTAQPIHDTPDGELAITMTARCRECGQWWAVLPGGAVANDLTPGRYLGMIYRPDVSTFEPARVGDNTLVGRVTEETIEGPGGVLLVRIDGSARGQLAP